MVKGESPEAARLRVLHFMPLSTQPSPVVTLSTPSQICCLLPLSAGVEQRNSGLDAWESTQSQATDLGTASCLRYFRHVQGDI